jgi:hypothetical protein
MSLEISCFDKVNIIFTLLHNKGPYTEPSPLVRIPWLIPGYALRQIIMVGLKMLASYKAMIYSLNFVKNIFSS